MLQATPSQLVFGCGMLTAPSIANWETISICKQKIIDKNNQVGNKNCKPHTYTIRNKLLMQNKNENKHEEPYVGHYPIIQVWKNGNVTIHGAPFQDA